MKKSKLIRLIAVMLVVLMTLASCSSSASTTSAGSTSGTSSTGEKISLTFATSAALNSMDPTLNSSGESMTIINYCTEGLYKTDKDGKLALGMASAVTTSDDGLTWTFTIRDDAYWSNGDKVTSNDFAYSWKRLANPDTGAEYAYMLMVAGIKNAQDVTYNGGSLDSLGIATPDDKTLVVTLDHPVTYLPNLLLGTYFMPEDEKFVEEKGAQFGLSLDDSIFNGQYTLTEWEVGGTEEKMEKNPKYYDADSVTTDELTAKVITDSQQLTMAWENGSVQQISLTGDNVDLYKSNSAFVTTSFPMVYFLSFNTKVSGLDNENLRKAISLSIDKQSIIDYILKDGSKAANFIIPEDFAVGSDNKTFRESANATYLETNKEQAKEYFEKAKQELGTDTFEFDFLYDEDSTLALVAADIQSELQSNLDGVKINLVTEPKNQRVTDMKNHNYSIGITRWGADYQDATTYLDMWTDNSSYNYGSWHNDRYEELYNLIYGEYATEADKRLSAMIEQESIILGEAAICPLYQKTNCYLLTTDYSFPYSTDRYSYMLQYAVKK